LASRGLQPNPPQGRANGTGLVDSLSARRAARGAIPEEIMPFFVYRGSDGPRGPLLRKTVRTRHLAYLQVLADAGRIRFAGPLYAADGQACGSLVVFEADDFEAARAVAESDPYLVEGVFEGVEVHATQAVLP